MSDVSAHLWVAKWFHKAFDMCFGNREWEDLPEDDQTHWLEVAAEFLADAKRRKENPDRV